MNAPDTGHEATRKDASQRKIRLGPNGKPVRPFVMPDDFRGRLYVYRYTIARRFIQLGILLMFFGTFNWGWQVFGTPLLRGNFSSSLFLGFLPMTDPFAALQMTLAGHVLESTAITGAVIVLLFYGLLGGRTWCAWACPINMVTDLASWARNKLGIKDMFRLQRNMRYAVLGLSLIMSFLTGVAAFEWISPISLLHRELIFGVGLGWTAVLGVFLFDLLILKHGWCGRLCPLGAFYGVVGKLAPIRVGFDAPTCTHCGECATVCPEPQVLNLKKAADAGLIESGECTNCGRCITVCPEDTLHFELRHLNKRNHQPK